MKGQKARKGTLKKVLQYIRPYWALVGLSILLAAVTVAGTLYIPILTGDAVDLIVGPGQVDFAGIVKILVEIAVVVGIAALAQWVMNLINNRITYRVVRDIRNEAFRKLQILPLKYIDSRPTGEVVSRVIADVDQFADGLLMGFTQLFSGVMTILGTLIFMLSVNVVITAVVVVITPVSLLVAAFIAKRTYDMFRLQSQVRGEQTGFVEEMVGNQKVVQAFGQEKKSLEQFDEINERLRKCSLRAIFFSSITNPSTRFVNSLVYTGVGIVGALSVVGGGLSVGQLSAFLSYANQYTKPFNEISGVVTELQNALACAGRVFELIEEPAADPGRPGRPGAGERPRPGVAFKMLSFSYRPEQPLIEHFHLGREARPAGCHRGPHRLRQDHHHQPADALLRCGQRLHPGGGHGHPGHHPPQPAPQLRHGASGHLAEERAPSGRTSPMGKPEATLEEVVRQAAKAAHAHSFIRRLPQGYDTVIGEDGGSMSQGQKQLLCIARVMLCLPPMLILDEATSSIDTRTEIRFRRPSRR